MPTRVTPDLYRGVMDIQKAAMEVNAALVKRGFGTAMSSSAQGYTLHVQEHPSAKLHFGFDQLGGLSTQLDFDGRPSERIDYLPTAAGASQVAEYLIQKVAGSN